MHLRLVKGAYWDYEIKHAQVFGYEDYPVYSKKSLTDISFLLCAKEILKNEKFYAKFATHNAHTISSVHQLGQGKDYEFQRLYGMGELYIKALKKYLILKKNLLSMLQLEVTKTYYHIWSDDCLKMGPIVHS